MALIRRCGLSPALMSSYRTTLIAPSGSSTASITSWMFATPCSRRACRSSSCVMRSEEHTSELQSQSNLVCRLLLDKNKRIDAAVRHAPAERAAAADPRQHHDDRRERD